MGANVKCVYYNVEAFKSMDGAKSKGTMLSFSMYTRLQHSQIKKMLNFMGGVFEKVYSVRISGRMLAGSWISQLVGNVHSVYVV